MAASIIDLATLPLEPEQRLIYNLCHPHAFSWTDDVLPTLQNAGLKFTTTSFDEWIAALKDYSASHSTQAAMEECPAVKLIDFYETTYGKKQPSAQLQFDTRTAQQNSPSLRTAPDIVRTGLIGTMLSAWMKKWTSRPRPKATEQKCKRKRSQSPFPGSRPVSNKR